jgi:hypothetical protein
VKFGIETYRNRIYKFCMKYCLQVNNFKMATARNFEVMSDKFNSDRICI